jgi:hypothetical protein
MNLWQACEPTVASGQTSQLAAFTAVPYFLFHRCYQIIISETFLHKSGTVQSADWIFINEALVWQWLDKFVTSDKTFYNACNKPLTQVSKREPDEHTLPSTKQLQCFLMTTEQLALDLSAHTVFVVLWVNSKYFLTKTCKRQ